MVISQVRWNLEEWQRLYNDLDKNGLVSDTEKVAIEYGKITDGYLKSSTGPEIWCWSWRRSNSILTKGVSLTGSVTSSPNEKADDQSDKTKERLWVGQSLYGTTDDSYFSKSRLKFKAEI